MNKKSALIPAALVAMAAAGPAFAQDLQQTRPALLQCGPHAATSWIGETEEGSDISLADEALQREISVAARGSQVVAFRVGTDGQELRVELVPLNSSDPRLQVFDGSGNLLAENDDYGSTLASRVDLTLAAGSYCAVIDEVGSNHMEVNARVSRADQPALVEEISGSDYGSDVACTMDTEAMAFAESALDAALAGGRISHVVQVPGENYLRFDLVEPTPLTLRAEASGPDPRIALFDGAGVMLAENDDAEGLNSRLDFASPLPAGTYCVAVGNVNSTAGDITVSAEKLDRAAFLRAAWRRGELPPSDGFDFPIEQLDINASRPTTALLGSDAVWFEFEVDQESVLIINAYGRMSGVDTMLRLFDGNGQMLSENDDAPGTTDSQLTPMVFAPGRYSLALTQIGSSGGVGSARPVMISVERFLRLK